MKHKSFGVRREVNKFCPKPYFLSYSLRHRPLKKKVLFWREGALFFFVFLKKLKLFGYTMRPIRLLGQPIKSCGYIIDYFQF